ncbi:uracil phosphoribosyltransferase [Priestia megaterium]|nr:uracil phosphoribosyltransferase [Priestia megaterium]
MSIKKENTKESTVLMPKNTSDKNFKYYWNEIIRALIVTK